MSLPRSAALAPVLGLVLALSTVAGLAALTGCATDADGGDKGDLEGTTAESEITLSGTRNLGKIMAGQIKAVDYDSPPGYRSFTFDAKVGDALTIEVTSTTGDPVAWITDDRYKVLAFNDDATPATRDAKIVYTVPAGTIGSFRIVFREYNLRQAPFVVKLTAVNAVAATCSYGTHTYHPGDQFKSSDGCNTCSCGVGGITCTREVCACNPATEPQHTYIGTPLQCMVITFNCPSGQVQFSNACGCGCETLP